MDDLHDHFGENAELEEAVRLRIRRYLVDNAAGSGRRFGNRTNPARITSTLWLHRTHGRVKMHFENARVGSPANCSACHRDAAQWRTILLLRRGRRTNVEGGGERHGAR